MFKIDGDGDVGDSSRSDGKTVKEKDQNVADFVFLQLRLMVCSTTLSEQMIIARQT